MNFSLRERSVAEWARALYLPLDGLALLSMLLTREVPKWTWLLVLGILLVRVASPMRLAMRTLFLLLIATFIGSLALFLGSNYHPILAVAAFSPVSHALLWLSNDEKGMRGWRLGLGFTQMILAASLSPEVYLPILILVYVTLASITISLGFLEKKISPEERLPKGYLQRGVFQSLLIFMSAILIFPLLPRMNRGGGGPLNSQVTQTGYTEEVNLSQWTKYSQEGQSTVAMRIYSAKKDDSILESIPMGLIRSRVLSRYDGGTWKASESTRPFRNVPGENRRADKGVSVRIIRENLGTTSLPLPYGTRRVELEQYGTRFPIFPLANREWHDERSKTQRLLYFVNVASESMPIAQDEPGEEELALPDSVKTVAFMNLSRALFGKMKDPDEKIKAVLSYFSRNKFTSEMGRSEEDFEAASRANKKLTPLADFLFIRKQGNCELFSSALALLLRSAGVPTRLVAGFRVTKSTVGDVLTIRMGDAHAWTEVWLPKDGWVPVDATPRIMRLPDVTEWVRDGYDWLSARWYEYVLSFDDSNRSLAVDFIRDRVSEILKNRKDTLGAPSMTSPQAIWVFGGFVLALLLAFGGWFVYRSRRLMREEFWRRGSRAAVSMEYRKFQKLLARGTDVNPFLANEYRTLYLRTRFGPVDEAEIERNLVQLRGYRARCERESRKTAS